MNTKEAAINRWEGIFLGVGMPPEFLRNVHGPCPVCGGTDRFRWDNYQGNGSYYCTQHGSGDGMQLFIDYMEVEFVEAAKIIDEMVGNVPEKIQQPVQRPDPRIRLNQIRGELMPIADTYVETYLSARELILPEYGVKFHPLITFFPKDGSDKTLHPCMVAEVSAPNGKPITYHMTYLARDGSAKADLTPNRKVLPPTQKMEGAAVRLSRFEDTLGIAEGIETALAASMLCMIPVWSCLSATGMKSWLPPEGVKELIIFGDNDENYTGQAAAYVCANRVSVKFPEIKVSVHVPPKMGEDFADGV